MDRLTERAEIDGCPGIWVKEGFANKGIKTWFNGYDEGYSAINKCAEYEDLEEHGKLLKLPCVVGDTVYAVELDEENFTSFHAPLKITEYEFDITMLELMGKCVFLTREEAEKHLRK